MWRRLVSACAIAMVGCGPQRIEAPPAPPPAPLPTAAPSAAAPAAPDGAVTLGPGASASFVLRTQRDTDGWLRRAEIDVIGAPGKAVQTLSFAPECGESVFRAASHLADVDFDGYLDLVVLREHGAKWGRYDVRLFDAKAGRFVESALTRHLGTLVNLTVDSDRKRIVTYSIGPSDPFEDVYRVEQGRLVLEASCHVEEGPAVVVRRWPGKPTERTPLREATSASSKTPCSEHRARIDAIPIRAIPLRG